MLQPAKTLIQMAALVAASSCGGSVPPDSCPRECKAGNCNSSLAELDPGVFFGRDLPQVLLARRPDLAGLDCLENLECEQNGEDTIDCTDAIFGPLKANLDCDDSNVVSLSLEYPDKTEGPFNVQLQGGRVVEFILPCIGCAQFAAAEAYTWAFPDEIAVVPSAARRQRVVLHTQTVIEELMIQLDSDANVSSLTLERASQPLFAEERVYEEAGDKDRLLLRFVDENGDGESDSSQLFQYDQDGSVRSVTHRTEAGETFVRIGNCCGDECRDSPSQYVDLAPSPRF